METGTRQEEGWLGAELLEVPGDTQQLSRGEKGATDVCWYEWDLKARTYSRLHLVKRLNSRPISLTCRLPGWEWGMGVP